MATSSRYAPLTYVFGLALTLIFYSDRWRPSCHHRLVHVCMDDLSFCPLDCPYHWKRVLWSGNHPRVLGRLHVPGRRVSNLCRECIGSERVYSVDFCRSVSSIRDAEWVFSHDRLRWPPLLIECSVQQSELSLGDIFAGVLDASYDSISVSWPFILCADLPSLAYIRRVHTCRAGLWINP